MDFFSIAEQIEASRLSDWLSTSLKAIPVIEAVHVMAISLVFGTILIVDLRLLGFPNTRRSFTRISDELLRFTWIGFVVAAITGALMFIADATTYVDNTAFLLKMVALVGAGVNMAVFQFVTARTVGAWDKDAPVPSAGRAAGAISILIWTTVIFLGRWIGFTQEYDFDIPQDVELDFEFLQDSSSSEPTDKQ